LRPLDEERYSRQILFRELGAAGQERLLAASAVLVGCGALGTAIAELLVRAGLGRLRIVDRDFVEPSNLQRQTLFDEADARDAVPKAVAAERKLRAINSGVALEGVVADLTPGNIEELLGGFPLLLDGTDNFESRLLLNDFSLARGVPWIYAAVLGSYGLSMTIRPSATPCLACWLEPEAGSKSGGNGADAARSHAASQMTCDTAGVLNTAVHAIASVAAMEAVKLAAGREDALTGKLFSLDVWTGHAQAVRMARNPNCRACARRDFTYLEGEAQPHVTMCGRDSVQIHERARRLNLEELAARLRPVVADVRSNGFLLRFRVPPHEVTVFADGRAVIKGTQDAAVARSLYARFLGA